MAHHFEIYRDKAGEFRVRFKYNSEVMWSSEGYASKVSAENLIASIKKYGPEASIDDFAAEEKSLIERLRSAEIPAADRIVRIDHNSEAFKDFEKAYKKFIEAVSTANDLGVQSEEEIEVLKSEIGLLGRMKDQVLVRSSQIWQFARNTILWIAEKAAGSIIEDLAVKLLAGLAILLGINIS